MQILFNGESEVLDKSNASLLDLLRKFDLNPDIITVELNEKIISRNDIDATSLKDGDRVEILMFMGGGM